MNGSAPRRSGTAPTCSGVFPHATTISRTGDMDHPDPFDAHGPPGQTGDHNAAPLSRRHHRAKTHLAYRSRQLGPARYLWRSPHGLERLVDATGTHQLDPAQALQLAHPGALDAALARIEASEHESPTSLEPERLRHR